MALWALMLMVHPSILTFPALLSAADDSVCARVKIEIQQELTLERQAFDAYMRINNGLSHITLENVDIDVSFADEAGNSILATSDPNDTTALFFIKVDTMDNISDIEGSGTVSPSTSADIHWLIIPAPGAANGVPSGTLYYVGATLRYTIGGEEHVTEVTPDYIYVKPMPMITMDYFLTADVYGDDAFTPEIEPPVPFSLGVRVANNGSGTARSLKIDSAQPKITENELGLLIGFNIEACKVNGGEVTPSLMADFGDVAGNSAKVASWIMTCSLSGRFVEFTADFSHSDELGGELTSLLEAANTHFLVHEVLADSGGKDTIPDFLAKDGDTYRLYESQNIDTVVTDQSSSSSIAASGGDYALAAPQTAGFMYVRLPDPMAGSSGLGEITRSDGKAMKTENVWLSKTRGEDHVWIHHINVFDTDSTGSYTVRYVEAANQPHPPVLQFIPDRTVQEGHQLSFIVEATDQDGTIPALTASSLPAGASFSEQADGTGIFDWTPAVGQAGTYPVTFIASDGALQDTKKATIRVTPAGDSDGDGIPDDWEMQHFGTLDRDGTGDADGDGISDLDEYLRGSDPLTPNQAPTIPVVQSPANNTEIANLQASLSVEPSTDPDSDPVIYTFELYADEGMTSLVGRAQGIETTTWAVPSALTDNTWYYWRAQASDGYALTNWAYGRFFVNQQNDAPTVPQPSSSSEFDTRTPVLQVTNSHDADGDILTYSFRVYTDSALTTLAASITGMAQGQNGTTSWSVSPALNNNTTYYWKVVVADEHGLMAETEESSFLIHMENTAPTAPVIYSPATGSEVASTQVNLTVTNSTDAQGDTLSYFYELDTVNTFDSANHLSLPAVTEQTGTTSCTAAELSDNTLYYWRVKANDGLADSLWTTGSFFVNTANDAPAIPVLKNPADAAWVNTLTPTLEVFPSTDPDNDTVTYTYEIFADEALTSAVASNDSAQPAWSLPANLLSDNVWYYWRVLASDSHGLASSWMQVSRFFIDCNGVNDGPSISFTEPSQHVYTNGETVQIAWMDSDPDNNATISLYYDMDNVGANGSLIATGIPEDPDGSSDDRYQWDIAGHGDVTYYVYAVITDGVTSQTVYCPYPVTIDRTSPTVTANPPGGSYTSSQNVTLSSNEPSDIHYTLDGTDPTTASMVYSAPIPINGNHTLKFMAIDEAGNTSAVVTANYIVQSELIVVARTDSGSPSPANWSVYVHRADGTATGASAKTDANGIAHFNPSSFTPGSYKFRLSYMGASFWSQVITVPETLVADIVVDHETVNVEVSKTTGAVGNGANVYVFNEAGTMAWNVVSTTDANGVAIFSLPAGVSFKFRINYMGGTYWSSAYTVTSGGTNTLGVNTGGGLLSIRICWAPDSPLANLGTMLYDGTKTVYRGLSATANADGFVQYDVPGGSYSVRVSYQGGVFWTEPIQVSTNMDIDFVIPHEYVDVTAQAVYQGAATPWTGLNIYLYGENQTYYRGQVYQSNSQGKVTFVVPQLTSKARTSYLGQTYWSDTFIWQDVNLNIPMAEAEVVVTCASQPISGVNVYGYTLQQTSANVSGSTDANGKVRFRLPAGSYLFKTTYMGNTYWTNASPLTQDTVNQVALSTGGGSFPLTVRGASGDPLPGVRCEVYNSDGTVFLGQSGLTDSDGNVSFNMGNGDYRFLVRYMGGVFWSYPVNVPDLACASVVIDHQWVEVMVDKSTGPIAGADVYLFDSAGTICWSMVEKTDENGVASFYLPVGVGFSFRANYMGNTYWSAAHTVASGGVNSVFVDAGGGIYQLTVLKGPGQPLSGLSAYLFDATGNIYRGITVTTDTNGIASFDVPEGTYSVRVDYQGGHFWTQPIDIVTDTNDEFTILHEDVTVSVLGIFQGISQPIPNLDVYLFSDQGVWRGQTYKANASGQVTFNVPELPNKARTSYLGQTYWSDIFTWEDASVNIPLAQVEVLVTINSQPAPGIGVDLWTPQGAYLAFIGTSNAEGKVLTSLPPGNYLFRANFSTGVRWSTEMVLTANQVRQVIISNQ